jgi:hypothetical protein
MKDILFSVEDSGEVLADDQLVEERLAVTREGPRVPGAATQASAVMAR